MSFEGYYQILCKNGHLYIQDVYEYEQDDEPWKCPDCGEGKAWIHTVDQTNGSDPQTGEGMPFKLKVKTPQQVKVCTKCSAATVLRSTTYEIPEEEEANAL